MLLVRVGFPVFQGTARPSDMMHRKTGTSGLICYHAMLARQPSRVKQSVHAKVNATRPVRTGTSVWETCERAAFIPKPEPHRVSGSQSSKVFSWHSGSQALVTLNLHFPALSKGFSAPGVPGFVALNLHVLAEQTTSRCQDAPPLPPPSDALLCPLSLPLPRPRSSRTKGTLGPRSSWTQTACTAWAHPQP